MTIKFTLAGGPTAVLEIHGLRILMDPSFDEPQTFTGPGTEGTDGITKTTATAIGPDQIGRIDLALVSHDHHIDNLDVSGREFLKSVPRVLTTLPGAGRLVADDIAAEGMGEYESTTISAPDGREVTVTAVPAHHGPDGVWQMVGPVIGFVIASEGAPTVYVSGDNSELAVVAAIAKRFPSIDLAVLFVGGARFDAVAGGAYLTLSNEAALEAAALLPKATIVPVHADGWAHFSQSAHELRDAFASAGIADRIVVVEPGATEELALA